MTNPKVVLVGPPGSGKSTVGPLLAARFGVAFDDADVDIEASAGKAIPDIFTNDGEPAFRALEAEVVAAGLVTYSGIFSLGGGAVLAEETRQRLLGHTVVFLSVSMGVGVRRTGMSTARPVLAGVNPRATYKALLDARLHLYRAVATVEIDTDERDPDQVTEAIVTALAGHPLEEGSS